jgi:hypothetical protein
MSKAAGSANKEVFGERHIVGDCLHDSATYQFHDVTWRKPVSHIGESTKILGWQHVLKQTLEQLPPGAKGRHRERDPVRRSPFLQGQIQRSGTVGGEDQSHTGDMPQTVNLLQEGIDTGAILMVLLPTIPRLANRIRLIYMQENRRP